MSWQNLAAYCTVSVSQTKNLMMKHLTLILSLLVIGLISVNCQSFICDSICYSYNSDVSPETEKRFLRQFGLDENTYTPNTQVIRDGDFIQTTTQLDSNRISLLQVTIEKRFDQVEKIESNIKYTEQTLLGFFDRWTYYKNLDYYNPIGSSGSNDVTVYWREFDLDNDGIVDYLSLSVITWNDIVTSYYCYIE
jgi:hypothetical protein